MASDRSAWKRNEKETPLVLDPGWKDRDGFPTYANEEEAIDALSILLDKEKSEEERFGGGISAQIVSSVPSKVLNLFVKYVCDDIEEHGDKGYDMKIMLEGYCWKWSNEDWTRVHQRPKKRIRDLMKDRGIRIPDGHMSVCKMISGALQEIQIDAAEAVTASAAEMNESLNPDDDRFPPSRNTLPERELIVEKSARQDQDLPNGNSSDGESSDNNNYGSHDRSKRKHSKKHENFDNKTARSDASVKTRYTPYDGRERLSDITKGICLDYKYSGNPDESLEDAVSALRDALTLAKIDPNDDHVGLIALPLVLKGQAKREFRDDIGRRVSTVDESCRELLQEFLPEEVRIVNDQEWHSLRLSTTEGGSNVKQLKKLVSRLENLSLNLTEPCNEQQKRRKLLEAISGVTELSTIRFGPPKKYRELVARVREVLAYMDREGLSISSMYTDRKYMGAHNPNRHKLVKERTGTEKKRTYRGAAVCYVCSKKGCHSSNHSFEERKAARQDLRNRHTSMLAEEESSSDSGDTESQDEPAQENTEAENMYTEHMSLATSSACFTDQALATSFRGIIFDTGCSHVSTASSEQYYVYCRYVGIRPGIQPDNSVLNTSGGKVHVEGAADIFIPVAQWVIDRT